MNAAPADPAALFGVLSHVATRLGAGMRDASAAELDDAWSRSGAMALTGRPARPLLAPPHVTAGLLQIAGWIRMLGGVDVDPLALLCERAALAGFTRGGDISCGGHARLLACADGWVAVSLARPDDVAAVPAWLGVPDDAVNWDSIARLVRARPERDVAARARLLGLPVAPLGSVRRADGPAVVAHRVDGAPAHRSDVAGALVVDLSSLWAGPLCARLLQRAGARVVKVESSTRPDGARASGEFFHVLHAGQESVALDFGSPGGRAALRRLLNAADVVIESSRPRALRQLGIERDEVLRHGRPRLWISITGYGGAGDAANSVAFGDDAAVAGGLVAWDGGRPCFCADAVADPATGLVAAAAAFAAWRAGRWKLDIALARVAAALAPDRNDWRARSPREAIAPRARTAHGRAPDLGHDTHRILEEIGGDRTAEPHALAIDA